MNLLLIAAGGAVGALARYGVGGWVQARAGFFPWGTIAVNVAGSFLLGFAMRYFEHAALPPAVREGLTIGLLGAFTTFSTFAFEAIGLAEAGDYRRAAGYLAASVGLGLLAVVAGGATAGASLGARS